MGFEWFGDEIADNIINATCEGGYITLEQTATMAKKRCPRDTGTLSRSITVTFDELPNYDEIYSAAESGSEQKTVKKRIYSKGYVSANTPYADKQHEDLSCNHTQGEAKYLEKAFNEKSKNFERNIKFAAAKQGLL